MDNKPLVSIIIPLYNRQHLIKKCIKSLINQSYKNIEIIIVNDGSTDNSLAVADQFAGRDKRIRVLNKQNEGTILARHDGYNISTGKYITFVDSDDLLPKDAIELLVNHIEEQQADIVMGAMTMKLGPIKWSNDEFFPFPKGILIKQPELFRKYYLGFFGNALFQINMCGKLFRKSVIENALNKTELFSPDIRRMGEDHFFTMKLFPFVQSMYRIGNIVYTYRYGGSVDHFNPNYPELFNLCQKRLELLDHYQYAEGYAPLFNEYVNMIYFHAQQLLEFKHGSKDDIIEFFKKELTSRSFIPRMKEYFIQMESIDNGINYIICNDYEGMYSHSLLLMHNRCDALTYKIKRTLLWLIERLNSLYR